MRLQWSFAQSIFKLTDGLIVAHRRVVPGLLGLDWASIMAAWLVAFAQVALLLFDDTVSSLLAFGFAPFLYKFVQWAIFGLMGLFAS